jgi:putative GTP pyrophosphokinase
MRWDEEKVATKKAATKKAADIAEIRDHYVKSITELEGIADYVSAVLRRNPAVHSIRSRIKDVDHLEKKIDRKYADWSLNATNYSEFVEDLIGIRVIHLYKHQWLDIHRLIHETFAVTSSTAYVRSGDSDALADQFQQANLDVKVHDKGYRSVHYVIESTPGKKSFKVEVQVRTIFEEGWSEIDHDIRYPEGIDDPLVSELLGVFNRLAGSSDELAGLLRSLTESIEQNKADHLEYQSNLNEAKKEIARLLDELKVSDSQKAKLQAQITRLLPANSSSNVVPDGLTTYLRQSNLRILDIQRAIQASIVPQTEIEKLAASYASTTSHFTRATAVVANTSP